MDNDTLQPRGSDGYDRLGKVRPLISHFSRTFADLYELNKELAVDEAIHRTIIAETVYANEARETRHQGVGAC